MMVQLQFDFDLSAFDRGEVSKLRGFIGRDSILIDLLKNPDALQAMLNLVPRLPAGPSLIRFSSDVKNDWDEWHPDCVGAVVLTDCFVDVANPASDYKSEGTSVCRFHAPRGRDVHIKQRPRGIQCGQATCISVRPS